jgi:tripartite-type tricarboxylate transporter receptor subunit TctC
MDLHKKNAATIAAAIGLPLALAMASASAQTASTYPNHPVVLIVPYAAGGVADVGMRILGAALSDQLKQQFVIENKPGPGAIVAAEAALQAAPDGYTTLMTGNNNAIAEALFNKLPYNTVNDFQSVATASFFDLLVVTRPDSPYKSLRDLIAAAKANPGKINIGTTPPGSTQNLGAELFLSAAGIKASIVTFRTSSDMANAVMRGDVDAEFEFFAAVHGLLDAKKLAVLASTGPRRTAYLPDVPTAIENGLKDFDVVSWNGLAFSAKTPKPLVDKLNAAMKLAIAEPSVQERAKQLGMEMRWSTPDDMTARMKSDIARWGAVIANAHIPKR